MKLTDNTVLVTGGGAGVGLALARAFCARGNRVLICGRDPDRLARAAAALGGLATIRCDLAR